MMLLKKTILGTLILLAALMLAAPTASATKTVTSPYVHEGEAAVEWKGGYDIDDGNNEWGMEASVAYGVTSWWETELAVEMADEHDDDFEAEALVFENKFQLAPKGALWVDPGLKVEYGRNLTGGHDELQAKLLLAKQIGQFSNTTNIAVGREIGEDSDDDLEYGFSYALAYDHSETFAYGLEWYSGFGTFKDDSDDFDEQSHQLGPVVYGQFAENIGYEAGVLVGLSEKAPDATIKAVVEYEF